MAAFHYEIVWHAPPTHEEYWTSSRIWRKSIHLPMVKAWIGDQVLREPQHEVGEVQDQLLEQHGGISCCSHPSQEDQGFQHLSRTPQKVVEGIGMVFAAALLGRQVVATRWLKKLLISSVGEKYLGVFVVMMEGSQLRVQENWSEQIGGIGVMAPSRDFHSVKLVKCLQVGSHCGGGVPLLHLPFCLSSRWLNGWSRIWFPLQQRYLVIGCEFQT